MQLEEFIKLTRMNYKKFAESIEMNPDLIRKYRKRTLRIPLKHARSFVRYSRNLITIEELGWDKYDNKIPYTLKELEAIGEGNGNQANTTVSADTMDTSETE